MRARCPRINLDAAAAQVLRRVEKAQEGGGVGDKPPFFVHLVMPARNYVFLTTDKALPSCIPQTSPNPILQRPATLRAKRLCSSAPLPSTPLLSYIPAPTIEPSWI